MTYIGRVPDYQVSIRYIGYEEIFVSEYIIIYVYFGKMRMYSVYADIYVFLIDVIAYQTAVYCFGRIESEYMGRPDQACDYFDDELAFSAGRFYDVQQRQIAVGSISRQIQHVFHDVRRSEYIIAYLSGRSGLAHLMQ